MTIHGPPPNILEAVCQCLSWDLNPWSQVDQRGDCWFAIKFEIFDNCHAHLCGKKIMAPFDEDDTHSGPLYLGHGETDGGSSLRLPRASIPVFASV